MSIFLLTVYSWQFRYSLRWYIYICIFCCDSYFLLSSRCQSLFNIIFLLQSGQRNIDFLYRAPQNSCIHSLIPELPLILVRSVSDSDFEGSRSQYPLPVFLILAGGIANGDHRLRVRSGTRSYSSIGLWASKSLVLSLSTSLVCKAKSYIVLLGYPCK